MRNPISEEERQQVQELEIEPLAKYVFRYLKDNLGSDSDRKEFYYPIVD